MMNSNALIYKYYVANLHFFEDKMRVLLHFFEDSLYKIPHFFEDKIRGLLHFFEDKAHYLIAVWKNCFDTIIKYT